MARLNNLIYNKYTVQLKTTNSGGKTTTKSISYINAGGDQTATSDDVISLMQAINNLSNNTYVETTFNASTDLDRQE